ncbi:MAG TPA: ABC transporter permease [Candidatus Ventrousia excrementavium]|uniref:ABC transporter permease n=1 Tax=Candidatus Ventrousia excrementavium TaxID=2840961 RepID=A0A9D1LLP5_9CLOT|nr:ABC transporter permease [Candidatus Ventrousia excrementavium]
MNRFLPDDFEALPADSFDKEQIVRPPTTYLKDVWRNFKKRKTALVSLIILAVIVLMVIFGPMMTKYNYYSNDYGAVNQPPGGEHLFGTDTLGRDMWARVWVGGRVSLIIAILATIIPYAIGMVVGGISGYFGGKVDLVIMRLVDIMLGIPSMIYNILLMIVLGSGNILTLVIAFTITGWLSAARTTRGLVLQLKTREFVMASETLGASPGRIILRHLIPNTLGISVVGMTMTIPNIIFSEAFLSFIGLGVAPPNPSWGQLIKAASETFKNYPYQFTIPCACISITLLCFNLLGDGLRDALDPRLRT